MRIIDCAVQYNEHGAPVELITLEIPLGYDLYDVPDELRHFLHALRLKKTADDQPKSDAELT